MGFLQKQNQMDLTVQSAKKNKPQTGFNEFDRLTVLCLKQEEGSGFRCDCGFPKLIYKGTNLLEAFNRNVELTVKETWIITKYKTEGGSNDKWYFDNFFLISATRKKSRFWKGTNSETFKNGRFFFLLLFKRHRNLKLNSRASKGLFTWRCETPGGRGNPARWGNTPVHMIYHFNLITFTSYVG